MLVVDGFGAKRILGYRWWIHYKQDPGRVPTLLANLSFQRKLWSHGFKRAGPVHSSRILNFWIISPRKSQEWVHKWLQIWKTIGFSDLGDADIQKEAQELISSCSSTVPTRTKESTSKTIFPAKRHLPCNCWWPGTSSSNSLLALGIKISLQKHPE